MKNSIINKILPYILSVIFFFLLWFVISSVNEINLVVPKINEVLNVLGEIISTISTYKMIIFEIAKCALVVVVSSIIAIALSLISCRFISFKRFISSYIIVLKVLPVITISFLILILFFNKQIRFIGTMIVAGCVIMPIIYDATLNYLNNIDKEIIDETRLVSNINLKTIILVNFRSNVSNISQTIVNQFALAFKVMIMAEVIFNVDKSIGKTIGEYSSYGEISYVYAWTIVIIIICLLIDLILKQVSKQIKKYN